MTRNTKDKKGKQLWRKLLGMRKKEESNSWGTSILSIGIIIFTRKGGKQ